MKADLKIFIKKDYDRVIYVSYEDKKISGINYNQGADNIDLHYAKSCEEIMTIFLMLKQKNIQRGKKVKDLSLINKAIEKYCEIYIYGK